VGGLGRIPRETISGLVSQMTVTGKLYVPAGSGRRFRERAACGGDRA